MEKFNIGNLIMSGLEFKGLTQKEAAEMMNIPYSTFNNYVRNKREPDFSTLMSILQFLEIDMNQTFSITNHRTNLILNANEAKIIKLYRSYSPFEQEKLLLFIENFDALINGKKQNKKPF
ncbi:MAG: XRE family transcriptional regulator [Erysipelotrichia bacterium]|nr:XRE family transcriptional regulator [Erysipelotrichia bacterium]NCC54680.1 XRE family transcriptional regulator [Erysipelotrichia bacterium]